MNSSHSKTIFLRVLSTLLAFLGSATAFAAKYVDMRRIEPVQGDAAVGAAKAVLCQACHGPNGNAVVPTFPRLAGQQADYLYHRLLEFKNANPNEEFYKQSVMVAQTAKLSDTDFRNLAVYFAAQTPSATPATASEVGSVGEHLYLNGDSARGIPPCEGCHGADGAGPAPRNNQYAAYPALRGQHAAFIAMRLEYFRRGVPDSSSNDFIMHGVARTLDDDAIRAIAAWLGSLPPADSR